MSIENEVTEIINRETTAWTQKSVEQLLSIFHPDMVWVWPTDKNNFDPISWSLPQGKFDYDRYHKIYTEWFSTFDVIKNQRTTAQIKISKQGDGAFAVFDIDTLWRSKNSEESHWLGRTGKTFVKTMSGWKMIIQVGVFRASSAI